MSNTLDGSGSGADANILLSYQRRRNVAENEDISVWMREERVHRVSPSIMNCGRICQNGGRNPLNPTFLRGQADKKGRKNERGTPYPVQYIQS